MDILFLLFLLVHMRTKGLTRAMKHYFSAYLFKAVNGLKPEVSVIGLVRRLQPLISHPTELD